MRGLCSSYLLLSRGSKSLSSLRRVDTSELLKCTLETPMSHSIVGEEEIGTAAASEEEITEHKTDEFGTADTISIEGNNKKRPAARPVPDHIKKAKLDDDGKKTDDVSAYYTKKRMCRFPGCNKVIKR